MDWFEVLILILVFLLVIEGLWLALKFRQAVQAGKRATPASQVSEQERVRVLVVGDSTAYGTGATAAAASMVGRLGQDFPHLTIVNAAQNAMRIDQVERQLAAMENVSFDVVMIHIGGVDTLLMTSWKRFEKHLKSSFVHARRLGAKIIVLVSVNNVGSIPLLHFPLNRWYTRRSRMISSSCGELCDAYQVVHIPLFTERSQEPLYLVNGHLFTNDGIHPNDDGYGVWYEQIKQKITPHLNDLDR